MVNKFKRGMGYIRDPKPHEYAEKLCTEEQCAALPPSVMLKDITPVEDQGGLGSCTGNAADNASKIRSGIVMGTFINGSRLANYYYARQHDGSLQEGDVGSTLSSVAWVLETIGEGDESLWPYNEAKYNVEPSAAYKTAAAKDTTTKATRLDAVDILTTINNIKVALGSQYPVMFGFSCTDQIFGVGSDGNLPMPDGYYVGGHATCIIGYDDNHVNANGSKGAFFIKNSWGTGWGAPGGISKGGYFWMPYQYLTNPDDNVGDAWAIISESDFVTPPPNPTHVTFAHITAATPNEFFAIGSDQALYNSIAPTGPWTSLGGICTSTPSAVSRAAGSADVFVRGSDGHVYHKSCRSGVWSSTWDNRGGLIPSGTGPTVVAPNPDTIDLYVVGTDYSEWHMGWTTANGWTQWTRVAQYIK
jgi:Cysteine protease